MYHRERTSVGHAVGQLLAVTEAGGWEDHARCRAEDPTLFFGPNRFEPKRERLAREAEAKAICATCPALEACREHALVHDEPYGVWGGLAENERRSLAARNGGGMRRTA